MSYEMAEGERDTKLIFIFYGIMLTKAAKAKELYCKNCSL